MTENTIDAAAAIAAILELRELVADLKASDVPAARYYGDAVNTVLEAHGVAAEIAADDFTL